MLFLNNRRIDVPNLPDFERYDVLRIRAVQLFSSNYNRKAALVRFKMEGCLIFESMVDVRYCACIVQQESLLLNDPNDRLLISQKDYASISHYGLVFKEPDDKEPMDLFRR